MDRPTRRALKNVSAAIMAALIAACSDAVEPPTEGSIQVSVATTGSELDPDGYTVLVDGGGGQAVGLGGSVTFSALQAGAHDVELDGVAANCTVAGSNPRSVNVTGGETAQTTFEVTCAATTGGLEIVTVTTGDEIDADGFTYSIDGGTAQPIGVNATVTIQVAPGARSVHLEGVAANCAVSGDNPRNVTVSTGATAQTTFVVTCSSTPGDVMVTTATTGSSLDPDGYSVTVAGGTPVAIGVNATTTVTGVPAGDRTVELTGVASNCSVSGENPRTVTVPEGGSVSTTFDVTCVTVLSNQIVFDTDRDGNTEIYVMSASGTGVQRLTNNPARDAEPYVSRDGTKIVFVSDRDGNNEIYVMNADGTGQTRLTTDALPDAEPAFSPDGTKILFSRGSLADSNIWVMDADGSNQMQLTTETGRDGLAQWSHDGTKIVFASERGVDLDIWVMNADGTSPVQLTTAAGLDFAPAWSPDGTKIAFTSERDAAGIAGREIYVMNADGTAQTRLTDNASADLAPQWSPDSSQIVFASERDGNSEVYVMSATGADPTNITNNAAHDFEASWSP